MTLRYLASIATATFLLLPSGARAATVTLGSSKDNTLYQLAEGVASNGAGDNFFAGRTTVQDGRQRRRGLISFDIAGNLPSSATIASVTLTLHMSKTIAGPNPIELHRVLADWGESASDAQGEEGVGAFPFPGDVTWEYRFFTSALWADSGGDFSSTVSATQSVDQVGFYTWGPSTQLTADVQNWLNNPATNFGWLLLADEALSGNAKRFDTKEDTTASFRPMLTITYDAQVGVGPSAGAGGSLRLEPGSPNPFRIGTRFGYALASAAPARLTIHDVTGRLVATLEDGFSPAGFHSAAWNARSSSGEPVSPGVYFARLESGGDVRTEKVQLVR